MTSFYSNGKLLLTGEYVVLDGANALAVPTRLGQSLTVESIDDSILSWKSLDHENKIWFETIFSLKNNEIIPDSVSDEKTKRLLEILQAVQTLNPNFLANTNCGRSITTKLDFPENWGLGSSSTLINNIANWANVDPFKLLKLTFGGSGYDVACAQYNTPITYQLQHSEIKINPIDFNPSFSEHLYFVHLNQKQNSRDGIAQYRLNKNDLTSAISEINNITSSLITCDSLNKFNILIEKHESIIASIINQEPIKERLFNDFNGAIKSLGAWGGDFVLVASEQNPTSYFKQKGYHTIISYQDMVL